MIKNYIEYRIIKSKNYRIIKSKNDYKIVILMSLKTKYNNRTLSQLQCDSIRLDHYSKNNNTLWLYNKDNKIINNFDLTDYEVKQINDKNKFIKYKNYS